MRKYDVAYVPNGPINPYPAVKLEDMTLEEIINKYLRMCAKANGQVSACSKCSAPCREGKRAIQLVANKVYNDPPIPLYGGKTLIEKAQEENMKRRENMESKIEQPKKKRSYNRVTDWWETSLASGDQVKWLMTELGLSRTAAKKKIYHYKYDHNLLKTDEPVKEKIDKEEPAKEIEEPKQCVTVSVAKALASNDSIEAKLEALLAKQEEHKKAMDRYMELYNKEKEAYESIKQKTDTLCSAMDILNE